MFMTNNIISLVLAVVAGYLLGSINFSIIVGKVFNHTDIRESGSGNAGTTNTLRVLGKKAAVIVLLGDILKCIAAVLIGSALVPDYGSWIGGLSAMVGHVYPVFFKFKGGKAVATGMAMMVLVCPPAGLSALGVFIIVMLIKRIVSLSSLAAFLTFPLFVWIFTKETALVWVAAAMFAFVAYLHRANIGRIIRGEEKSISFKSSK